MPPAHPPPLPSKTWMLPLPFAAGAQFYVVVYVSSLSGLRALIRSYFVVYGVFQTISQWLYIATFSVVFKNDTHLRHPEAHFLSPDIFISEN